MKLDPNYQASQPKLNKHDVIFVERRRLPRQELDIQNETKYQNPKKNIQSKPNPQTEKEKFDKLIKKNNRILFKASSQGLFNFFPDVICVEENRVSFIKKSFFGSSQIHTIDIKDILNVAIMTAPLFAGLEITSRTTANLLLSISRLKKKQAIEARKLIEGLRILSNENIDTSKYDLPELMSKLQDLNRTSTI